ncbi:hypothetical protein OSB04_031291 [Centaurea solstitialis]|uniref:Uncharacterized protein n=1 Tax=Centaurea solstitialis TaxID=347529 RepID=A0AA38SA24_9ASTR|nr:hypothetical protein OSB04_031291 [Centaurea solstitialis]
MASKVKKVKQSTCFTVDQVTFSPCNYIACLDHNDNFPGSYIIAEFLRKCPLYKALTYSPKMSRHLLSNFWATCQYDAATKEVCASVLSTSTYDVSFTVDDLRRVLDLPTFDPYEKLPSNQDLKMVATTIGYVQGPNVKDRNTLYRKYMGGVWNFFFLHLLQCLSRKTGSVDQAHISTKQLAYVLIFQKKIDFAAYFFQELVKMMGSSKKCNVPFVRFISMLIADKLGSKMPADVDNYFDLKVCQIRLKGRLKKESLPTDRPLPLSMVSFATCPNPVWGDYFSNTNRKLKSHPTSEPRKSRKRLLSQLTPFGFSSKKPRTPKNKDSRPSTKDVELGPIKTRASDSPLVPSQKDIAGDGSDISPFLGHSSPPHAHGLPPEIDNLDDINIGPHVDVVDDINIEPRVDVVDKDVQQAQVSDRFDSIPQSSLADLIARVTALSDSQSAILQSLADLHARSNAQTEVNRAILRSLEDLHVKIDAQTKISNMVLEKTAAGLGTSWFTDLDRELLNQIGQRVQNNHGLLDGIHNNVSKLLDDSDNREDSTKSVSLSGDEDVAPDEDGDATTLVVEGDQKQPISQPPIDLSVAAEPNKPLLDKADTAELEKVDLKREEEAQVKKAERIKWYNDTILHRCVTASITSVEIKGPENLTQDSDQIFLIIGRADGVVRTEKLSGMHAYGVSEWMETTTFVKQSQSMYREYVLSHFEELRKKMRIIKNHYKPSAPSS